MKNPQPTINPKTRYKSKRSVDRAAFVATVRGYVGTPYAHQGRTPGHRLDCIGVIVCGLQAHRWRPKNPARVATLDYAMRAQDDTLEQIIQGEAQRIDLADAQPGDVAVFRWPGQEFAQHCGVLSQRLYGTFYFVHAFNSPTHRTVIEHALRDEWLALLVDIYRLRALTV